MSTTARRGENDLRGTSPSAAGTRPGMRPDIEGLRSIAIGTVLLYHAGIPWFPGGFVGVDIFFVLSGFLITGLLVREVERSGRVDLPRFWARRARRLLPASALVLAVSAVVTYLWLPITQRSVFGGDLVTAALYVVNWGLANRSVDYLAEDVGASPVQHYWSLSVEEQFYVVWPVAMLLVAFLVARGRHRRVGFLVAIGVMTVASLVWSVTYTASDPSKAYFVTTTRLWELGIGAMLAVAAPLATRVPSVVRAAVGWLGLAAIVWAVLRFSESAPWPGSAALVPVLGAAALVGAGIVETPGSPNRLLGNAPMVWIGGLSYSLYLWHWPMLIGAEGAKGDELTVLQGTIVVLVAFVPAWLCHVLVENPVRFGATFAPTKRALQLAAALTATSVVIALALQWSGKASSVDEATPEQAVGAGALLAPGTADTNWAGLKSVDAMRPTAVGAPDDRPAQYDDRPECQQGVEETPELCTFGDADADKTVVITGDSKVVQWQPLLTEIAQDQGWKLVQVTKSSCGLTDAWLTPGNGTPEQCHAWGQAAKAEIMDLKPDLVISSMRSSKGSATQGGEGSREAGAAGLASVWQTFEKAGIPVVALLDTPAPDIDPSVYECVAEHPDQLDRCDFDRSSGVESSGAPTQEMAARQADVPVVDMTDVICPQERCAPVIGNVLVYRQGSHITNTYAMSARTQVEQALAKATDGAFGRG